MSDQNIFKEQPAVIDLDEFIKYRSSDSEQTLWQELKEIEFPEWSTKWYLKIIFILIKYVLIGSKNTLIVNPTEMIGRSYRNQELETDAKIVAGILTTGNLIDFVCIQGLLSFSFIGTPFCMGLPASLILNLLILSGKNYAGVAIARSRPGTLPIRMVGGFSLIGLSTISCLVAGVGIELTLNQSGLVNMYASELVDSGIEKEKVAKLQPTIDQYNLAKNECDVNTQKLDKLKRTDLRYETIYLQTYGMVSERNKTWILDDPGIPFCVKSQKLSQRVVSDSQKFNNTWQVSRLEIGNDLEFLKQKNQTVYSKNFTVNDEFKSGDSAVKFASQSYYNKLLRGEYAGLGISLFFSSLSIVTTIAGCGAVMAFPFNRDAKLSWDPQIRRQRDRIIEQEIGKRVARVNQTVNQNLNQTVNQTESVFHNY